jgi:hypothetical protein
MLRHGDSCKSGIPRHMTDFDYVVYLLMERPCPVVKKGAKVESEFHLDTSKIKGEF